jgi:hypothetical protein
LKLVVAAVLLIGASAWAWAQDAPPDAAQDSEAQAGQQAQAEYGGPSVLSRGGAASLLRSEELVRLQPFISITGSYDSGLGGTRVNDQGETVNLDSYGVYGTFGVTGTHTWEHSVLDLDYRGSYRNRSNYSYGEGLDNSLQLNFQHQLSPRLGITIGESASRTNTGYSLPLANYYGGGFSSYNPLYSSLAANNMFDMPSNVAVSTVRLSYQYTARWSVSVGGTGIITRQRVQELFGTNGYVGSADVAYRLSRYQTISFNYAFTHLGYKNQMGQSDIHGAGLAYSVRLGRYWELGLGGGVSRVESLRAVPVELDPVLALLLGLQQNVVFYKSHDIIYSPYGSVHLTRVFRRASWSLGYDRSVVPGNGVYATSGYETADTSFSYSGTRRLTLQAGAAYSRYSAMMQSLGRYRNYSVSGGFTYRLAKGFSTVGRVDARRYYVSGSSLDRTLYGASVGFAWNPGAYPLALW